MLVCLLGLWQGTGWAATYSYSVDGYEYEIRDYTKKYARLLSIPNTETVRIPADVTYNGVVYPVTKIRSKIKSDNVKDIYFTRVLPTNVQTGELEFDGRFGIKSIVNIQYPSGWCSTWRQRTGGCGRSTGSAPRSGTSAHSS